MWGGPSHLFVSANRTLAVSGAQEHTARAGRPEAVPRQPPVRGRLTGTPSSPRGRAEGTAPFPESRGGEPAAPGRRSTGAGGGRCPTPGSSTKSLRVPQPPPRGSPRSPARGRRRTKVSCHQRSGAARRGAHPALTPRRRHRPRRRSPSAAAEPSGGAGPPIQRRERAPPAQQQQQPPARPPPFLPFPGRSPRSCSACRQMGMFFFQPGMAPRVLLSAAGRSWQGAAATRAGRREAGGSGARAGSAEGRRPRGGEGRRRSLRDAERGGLPPVQPGTGEGRAEEGLWEGEARRDAGPGGRLRNGGRRGRPPAGGAGRAPPGAGRAAESRSTQGGRLRTAASAPQPRPAGPGASGWAPPGGVGTATLLHLVTC